MKRLIFLTSLVLVLAFSLSAYGVRVEIAGVVTEAKTGDPLPGANVLVKATNVGAATGDDGRFSFLYDI